MNPVMSYEDAAWHPPIDHRRGRAAMWLFILGEGVLFLMLFFAYFYLRAGASIWAEPRPSMRPALVMLAVLLTSSGILHWGQRALQAGRPRAARRLLIVTALLGAAFLVLQVLEFQSRLEEMTPSSNAYGSLFFTITGVHGVHVALGVAMLAYVSLLPDLVGLHRPPHRPFETAALYWHFVDVVWVVIVAVLYLGPGLTR